MILNYFGIQIMIQKILLKLYFVAKGSILIWQSFHAKFIFNFINLLLLAMPF